MMHQYLRDSYTKKDVSQTLGISENSLTVRFFSKKYDSGLKNDNGKKLKFVKAIYLDKGEFESERYQLLYVEFKDETGLTYSYIKDNYNDIDKQIALDGFSSASSLCDEATNQSVGINLQLFARNKSIKEKKNMSNLTELDLRSLEKFADDLESFQERVKQVCAKMESGIVYCQSEMKDEQSKAIISKARTTIDAIMQCINPSVLTLEKVKQLIDDIKNADISL